MNEDRSWRSRWQLLGQHPAHELPAPRRQLHRAARVAASIGKALLPLRPDDSHQAFHWLKGARLMAQEAIHAAAQGSMLAYVTPNDPQTVQTAEQIVAATVSESGQRIVFREIGDERSGRARRRAERGRNVGNLARNVEAEMLQHIGTRLAALELLHGDFGVGVDVLRERDDRIGIFIDDRHNSLSKIVLRCGHVHSLLDQELPVSRTYRVSFPHQGQ